MDLQVKSTEHVYYNALMSLKIETILTFIVNIYVKDRYYPIFHHSCLHINLNRPRNNNKSVTEPIL